MSGAAAAAAASGVPPQFAGVDLLDEVVAWVNKDVAAFSAKFGYAPLPTVTKSRELDKGDFVLMLHQIAGKGKDVNEFGEKFAKDFTTFLAESKDFHIVKQVYAVRGYLNMRIDRAKVFKLSIEAVLRRGAEFGRTDRNKGKKVIIEHTSSNPNAPLHIGNLRNSLLGSHLTELMRATGYEVQQLFYVNDLGAQIGLTALGYSRVYDRLKPTLKIDQWIGMMYAVMNTFSELQKLGLTLDQVEKAVAAGEKLTVDSVPPKPGRTAEETEELAKGIDEYVGIYADLRQREPAMFRALYEAMRTVPSIKDEAGQLNLRYERNDPEAVKIFRKMVNDCLCGVQETLDTYSVRHDRWDYESELGWEGSNDRVLSVLKDSPYFVPQTATQGGYLDLARFIADQGFPTGKKGYQEKYPPLYILRPDGSTLYTFRDVVYSLKKCQQADLVLNVICTEQNLAQEKVRLSLMMLNPDIALRQVHMNYELVKLVTGRMSGRRGRYLLADDLYQDLKETIHEDMVQRASEKQQLAMSPEMLEKVAHEVATASMKYTLLGSSPKNTISFDIKRVTSMEDGSAVFVLYNSTRLRTLRSKYDARVRAGEVPALPAFDSVDFSSMTSDDEWQLLLNYVLPFTALVHQAACPPFPAPPALPEFGTHKVAEFLQSFVREFSSYYKAVRIIDPTNVPGMHARIYFCQALQQMVDNALRLLTIQPLERM